jgi:poly-beta-1,6-N-acetyl-D-glucosamine synthase
MANTPHYVIVSPVKDEANYVELTLRSVISQTSKPVLWVIVNDGSTDGTAEILHRYAEMHSFIRIVNKTDTGARRPGAGVVEAFNRGYGLLNEEAWEFIVKLDCDLSFGPEYFERLIRRFLADGRLGIASGVYLEMDKAGRWKQIDMPPYHAFGACKVLRRKCFEQIGGFVAAAGWDTVDEIRALARGWETRHFADLQTRHHKPEGSGVGTLKTSKMHGEVYYATGGDPFFLVFKILHRMAAGPFLVGGMALTLGYLRAMVRRNPRLVSDPEMRCYRRLLRKRLWSQAKVPLALMRLIP